MASQDGQPDCILRGCAQPTVAQDLPEPAAGPPAGGALEAAAGPPARRWCFGGGGCGPRQASTRAASVAGSWRQRRRPVRVRAVARSTKSPSATASRGWRVCPRRRSWPSIPASHRTAAAEPRQPLEVGDGGGRVQGDPAAVSAAHDAVEPRRALPAHSGVAAPWLHSRTGQEGQLRGTSPTWTHLYQLEIHAPHLRRYVRRPAVLPPSVFLAPSLLPAVRPPSTLPTPPATPVAGVVPGVVLPDAPATLPLSTCFLRCVPPQPVRARRRPAALPLPAALVRPAVLPLLPSHARRVSNCSEPTLLRVRAGGAFL